MLFMCFIQAQVQPPSLAQRVADSAQPSIRDSAFRSDGAAQDTARHANMDAKEKLVKDVKSVTSEPLHAAKDKLAQRADATASTLGKFPEKVSQQIPKEPLQSAKETISKAAEAVKGTVQDVASTLK